MRKVLTKKKRKPLPVRVRKAASLALQGNSFWMARSKHGSDAIISTPIILLQTVEEYLSWVETHPLYRAEWKAGSLRKVPVKRPATLIGFTLFCGASESWWKNFKQSKTVRENKGFLSVIEIVERSIYNQKYEGAAAGFFNANIIARDLGLVDRVDQTSGDQPILQPLVQIVRERTPKLANDEKEIG